MIISRSDPRVSVVVPPLYQAPCLGPGIIHYLAAGVHLALGQQNIPSQLIDHLDDKQIQVPELMSKISPSVLNGGTVCVATFLGNRKDALALLRLLRKDHPTVRLIIFGPVAGIFYKQILKHSLADCVVTADAEYVLPDLLKDQGVLEDLSSIPNLAYMHDGRMVVTKTDLRSNVDDLPLVGPFLCESGIKPVHVLTTWGCDYRCSFCDRPQLSAGKLRLRSIDRVVEEIDLLGSRYQQEQFTFGDANFVVDRDRAIELCRKLRKLPRVPRWTCATRPNSVDPDLLKFMKWAGCEKVYFGAESIDPGVLHKIGKGHGSEMVFGSVQAALKIGLKVGLFLMAGMPGESKASVSLARRFVKTYVPPIELTFNWLVVLPGSRAYYDQIKAGKLNEDEVFEDDTMLKVPSEFEEEWRQASELYQYFEVAPPGQEDFPCKRKKIIGF